MVGAAKSAWGVRLKDSPPGRAEDRLPFTVSSVSPEVSPIGGDRDLLHTEMLRSTVLLLGFVGSRIAKGVR